LYADPFACDTPTLFSQTVVEIEVTEKRKREGEEGNVPRKTGGGKEMSTSLTRSEKGDAAEKSDKEFAS